jgi:hypothetical protein
LYSEHTNRKLCSNKLSAIQELIYNVYTVTLYNNIIFAINAVRANFLSLTTNFVDRLCTRVCPNWQSRQIKRKIDTFRRNNVKQIKLTFIYSTSILPMLYPMNRSVMANGYLNLNASFVTKTKLNN